MLLLSAGSFAGFSNLPSVALLVEGVLGLLGSGLAASPPCSQDLVSGSRLHLPIRQEQGLALAWGASSRSNRELSLWGSGYWETGADWEAQQVPGFSPSPRVILCDYGQVCAQGWRRAGVRGQRGDPTGCCWADRGWDAASLRSHPTSRASVCPFGSLGIMPCVLPSPGGRENGG